jgi:hypothetical protein
VRSLPCRPGTWHRGRLIRVSCTCFYPSAPKASPTRARQLKPPSVVQVASAAVTTAAAHGGGRSNGRYCRSILDRGPRLPGSILTSYKPAAACNSPSHGCLQIETPTATGSWSLGAAAVSLVCKHGRALPLQQLRPHVLSAGGGWVPHTPTKAAGGAWVSCRRLPGQCVHHVWRLFSQYSSLWTRATHHLKRWLCDQDAPDSRCPAMSTFLVSKPTTSI